MNNNYSFEYVLYERVYGATYMPSHIYFCKKDLAPKEYKKLLLFRKRLSELKDILKPKIIEFKNIHQTISRTYGNEFRERGLSWDVYHDWKYGNYNSKVMTREDLQCYRNHTRANFYHSVQQLISTEYMLYHTFHSILNNKTMNDIVPNMDDERYFELCRAIVNMGGLNINEFFVRRRNELNKFWVKHKEKETYPIKLLIMNNCFFR